MKYSIHWRNFGFLWKICMDKDMMVQATCPLDLLVYQERSSHPTYGHCSGHCLNLVINLMLYPRYKIYLIN